MLSRLRVLPLALSLALALAQDTFVLEGPDLPHPVFGIQASFGPRLPSTRATAVGAAVVYAESWNGCPNDDKTNINTINTINPINPINHIKGNILMLDRGNCTFEQKALQAQKAGAVMLLVANTHGLPPFAMAPSDAPASITIPCGMVSGYARDMLIDNQSSVSVWLFWVLFDYSALALMVTAVCVVGLSAWWSAESERARATKGGTMRDDHDDIEVQVLTMPAASCFVVFASASLLVLFYFMKHLVYVLMFIFAVGACNALFLCLRALSKNCACSKRLSRETLRMPWVDIHVSHLAVLLMIPSLMTPVCWFVYRNSDWSWLLQDVMCICLCMVVQRQLRLPNIKVSAVLLVSAFMYDIFWVFISPLFFSSSVMVTVATGGDSGEMIPMLIRIPHFHELLGGYAMLGLGDMVLPGLLMSFFLRFDYQHLQQTPLWKGYFSFSLFMYTIGMVICNIALILMKHGQPALLYLVPCCLGGPVALAYTRRELPLLWSGDGMNVEEGTLCNEEETLLKTSGYQAEVSGEREAGNVNTSLHPF